MRIGLTIMICLIVFSGCRGQKQKNENSFETNRFAKDSFYYAATLIDTTNGKKIFLLNGFTAIFVPERWGDENDDFSVGNGIPWPTSLAPFPIALVPIGYHKSARVREAADALYAELQQAGFEVLFDDRNERPGVMFADMDLIGIPHRLVLGDKGLDKGMAEYKARRDTSARDISLTQVVAEIARLVEC